MRTATDWDTTIFTQVNQSSGLMIGICHENEYNEALQYAKYLYVLMKAKFGEVEEKWFNSDTKAACAKIIFKAELGVIVNQPSEDYIPRF